MRNFSLSLFLSLFLYLLNTHPKALFPLRLPSMSLFSFYHLSFLFSLSFSFSLLHLLLSPTFRYPYSRVQFLHIVLPTYTCVYVYMYNYKQRSTSDTKQSYPEILENVTLFKCRSPNRKVRDPVKGFLFFSLLLFLTSHSLVFFTSLYLSTLPT